MSLLDQDSGWATSLSLHHIMALADCVKIFLTVCISSQSMLSTNDIHTFCQVIPKKDAIMHAILPGSH